MYLALGAYGLAILIPFLLYVAGRVIVEIYLATYGAGVICSRLEGPAGPFSMPLAHAGDGAHAEAGRWNAPRRPVPAHPLAGVPTCTNGPVSAVLDALDGVPAVGAPERFRSSGCVLILPPGTVPRGFAAPPPGCPAGRFAAPRGSVPAGPPLGQESRFRPLPSGPP